MEFPPTVFVLGREITIRRCPQNNLGHEGISATYRFPEINLANDTSDDDQKRSLVYALIECHFHLGGFDHIFEDRMKDFFFDSLDNIIKVFDQLGESFERSKTSNNL